MSHFQYLSWPDYGVPTSAVTLIDFLGAVKRQQRKMVKALGLQWTGHPQGPPMVVHCSAGIGRTGEILGMYFSKSFTFFYCFQQTALGLSGYLKGRNCSLLKFEIMSYNDQVMQLQYST